MAERVEAFRNHNGPMPALYKAYLFWVTCDRKLDPVSILRCPSLILEAFTRFDLDEVQRREQKRIEQETASIPLLE